MYMYQKSVDFLPGSDGGRMCLVDLTAMNITLSANDRAGISYAIESGEFGQFEKLERRPDQIIVSVLNIHQ